MPSGSGVIACESVAVAPFPRGTPRRQGRRRTPLTGDGRRMEADSAGAQRHSPSCSAVRTLTEGRSLSGGVSGRGCAFVQAGGPWHRTAGSERRREAPGVNGSRGKERAGALFPRRKGLLPGVCSWTELLYRKSRSPALSTRFGPDQTGSRPGPAMAQQRALPQSKETLLQSYNKRLKDDIKSIMDNFTEIIKTAKIEDETQVSRATQGEQDNYEMHVRAANIVRAGESLMKLVSDLKQFLILNDFPSVNEAIDQRNQQLRALQEECDRKLITLRDEVSIDLYELEEEYYSSRYK